METEKIWNKYAEELLGFLIAKTGDRDLAEDILQDVFIKVHLKKSQLKSQTHIRSWLYRIAGNTLTDFFRKKTQHPNPILTESSEEINTTTHCAENCLMPLINKLPERYQQALFLSELQNLKQQQVAKILGISVSGAKSRIQRGRKLLQEGYIDCCNYSLNENGKLVGEARTEEECKVCQ